MIQPRPKTASDADTPSALHVATPQPRGITFRSVALGAILIPFNAFWVVRQERLMYGPYASTISLFANVVFLLFLMVAVNALLKRFLPRLAFSQGELLTLYTMLCISTGLAGLDGVGIWSQMMGHGAWFGEARGWGRFLDAFPNWLVVRDKEILRGHYLGNSTFYHAETLRAWATPIFAWTLFSTLLLWVACCISILVRKQWADRERLTFPIVWLPMEMTEEGVGRAFFRNPLMWAGFIVAAGLSLWNGIAFLYPSLPALNVGMTDIKPYLTAKPWSAIDMFTLTGYPLAIGLGFLLPLDLLFSCWFFFFFWKAQMVMSSQMGWDITPEFPFIKEQGFGSVLGLFAFYLWTGRKHYAEIWRQGARWLRRSERSETTEALSEGGALFGLGAGLFALFVFGMAAKVAWWVMLGVFALYLPMIVIVTRIRAELGAPVHDFHFMGPDNMIPRMTGITAIKQSDMAFFTFCFALTRAHRSDTMPVALEGLQMARLRQLEARKMLFALMLAAALGAASAFWAFEHQAYSYGAAAKFNQGYGHADQAFERMNNWVGGVQDRKPNSQAMGAIGGGFLTALLLLIIRLRWFGFPLHPIGYAISSSWSINLIWLPMMIAWLFKALTMRYGGLRAYRRFLPFFLGLALGDCVMGSAWALLSLLWNVRTYNFFGG